MVRERQPGQTSYAPPEWQAAAWRPEHSFRAEFGPNALPIELTGAKGQPLQISDDPEVAALASRRATIAAARRQEALVAVCDDDMGDAIVLQGRPAS